MNRILRMAAPVALAATAACADTIGVSAPPIDMPAAAVGVVECTVRPAASTVRCGDPAVRLGASADLIVGGQGTYVQLRSANVAYDSLTEVFSADLTLQNLLGQPVGTEDGTTVEGVRIFFHLLPVVTSGAGTAELRNPDGVEAFTAGAQPYFLYPEILAPYERTAPKRWEWTVSKSVEEFTFQVFVSAKVPNQDGVLRWTRERGEVVTRDLFAVWGTGPNDVWAGGDRTMMYNNGTRWVVIPGDWDGGVTAIHGSATDDVWAVGGQLLRRFDGRRWSKVAPPVNENFSGVWASSPSNAYVTGGAFGWVIRWDGAGWDTVFAATPGRRFNGVWGSSDTDVHVLGTRFNPSTKKDDSYVWHWDGAQWDSTAVAPGTYLSSIWGSSASDVYAVGHDGKIVHFDGASWSTVGAGVTTYPLRRVWGSGPGDVWAVGGGYHPNGLESTVLHFDGAQWTEVQSGGPKTATAVFAPNPDKVYVLGHNGMIQKRSGGQWQAESSVSFETLQGVWPLGENDALAGTCGGVMRDQGHGWQTVHATDDCLTDVWATPGGAQIFAVGYTTAASEPVLVHWDGAAWTRTEVADVRRLEAVWGFSASDVYAAGYSDAGGQQRPVILHWDGAAWMEVPTGQDYGQLKAIWGSAPDDLYAVGTRVLHWDGTSWTPLTVHYAGDLYEDVWGSGPDDVYVTGGGVYHWNGASWSTFFPQRVNFRGYGVWGSGPDDVYVVGTQSLHFNGASWTEVNIETSSTLYDVGGWSARSLWAVGAGGVVMRGRR